MTSAKSGIVDLFAGCGGMSLGFSLAGFESLLACEIDGWAADTYAANHRGTTVLREDIRNVGEWKELVRNLNDLSLLGVVGGPPCQGFSLSGNRDPKDPRNSLFMEFSRCVQELKPHFFVMENVPGLLSMRTADGQRVRNIIADVLSRNGYNVEVLRLNAADYGVPQSRERVFFVGIRSDWAFVPGALVPAVITPVGKQVSVNDAIGDLPVIEAGEGAEVLDYSSPPSTPYQEWARSGSARVANHVAMRHTARLVDRFKVIRAGESVADVPLEYSAMKRGDPKVRSGKVFGQNNMRVFGDRPAPTVAASFQSNFIHPSLHRNFTAREGARLQSFPDSYVFRGKRTTMSWEKNLSQYQQIGNAVPPLLAKAIGERILRYFEDLREGVVPEADLIQTSLQLDAG